MKRNFIVQDLVNRTEDSPARVGALGFAGFAAKHRGNLWLVILFLFLAAGVGFVTCYLPDSLGGGQGAAAEGLHGGTVEEIAREHGISRDQIDQYRDRLEHQ